MPLTRSSSRVKSQGKELASRSAPSPVDDDVIIISSDDEAPDNAALALRKAQQEVRSLKKKMLAKEASGSQVLSDQRNHQADDSFSSARFKKLEEERLRLETNLHQATADIKKLQTALRQEKELRATETSQVKRMRKRAKAAESENASLKAVNQELRNGLGGNGNDNTLHELENHIICEVCTEKLWHPYTLSGCGHTFCQGCLTDWFTTIFQNALTANAHHAHYTCPTCRAPVHQKPTEDYALKSVVRAIAHAIDPVGGSPPALPRNQQGHGLWARFFG